MIRVSFLLIRGLLAAELSAALLGITTGKVKKLTSSVTVSIPNLVFGTDMMLCAELYLEGTNFWQVFSDQGGEVDRILLTWKKDATETSEIQTVKVVKVESDKIHIEHPLAGRSSLTGIRHRGETDDD
ncbi:hypothetical protein [Armatimonas sp.]|uniref:hypothetical protein n=1 Tax=Armatimonas sp. TaxID=1872638 RepID=UPI00286C5174|nr:hypothetical protein [Armatimonas sp.]